LQRALDVDPTEVTVRMELGLALLAGGRSDEALATLRPMLQVREVPNLWYYARPARELTNTQQFELAEAFLDRGDVIYPGDPDIQFQRGRLRERQGRWDEALAAYEAAERPGTNNVEAEVRQGAILLGQLEDPARAQAVLSGAVDRNPEHVWALYYLASVEARLGDTEAASEHIERAIAGGLADADALRLAAHVAMGRGDYEGALARCQQILETDADDALARFNAAQCLLALDRREEARAIYEPARGAHALQELGQAVSEFERELGAP
jgi:tetratricopeptide (TPR) repeat protein